MTTPPAITAAFAVQAAIRDELLAWPGLVGVDVVTGPRRKDVLEGIVVARPRASSLYRGGYRAEEGTVQLVCDAFVSGAGEDAIDAARRRAEELLNEAVACLSLNEHTGGDITIGGAVLATTDISVEEADNYIEADGARLAGHGYTIAATLSYTARHLTS